jgi:hypothetical protein
MDACKTLSRIPVIFLVTSLTVGCKPGTDARLKTLDQFAGGNGRYACKGSYADNSRYMPFVKGITSSAQKKAIENALSAVPQNFKDRIFLGPVKSFIEVTDKIGIKCQNSSTAKANSRHKASIFACPVVESGSATVYVDKEPANIQSSLVRALAYYIVKIDSKIEVNISSPTRLVVGFADQGDVKQSKKFLGALAFLDEVASGGNSNLRVFSHLLPTPVLNARDKISRDEAFFDPMKTNAGDRDAFAEYVYAEIMDSALCSGESRKILAQKFPNTLRFFGEDLTGPSAAGSGDGEFALREVGAGPTSQGTVSEGRAAVVTRSASDSIPEGLQDSGKIIHTVNSNGSETPTKLYYNGKQQYWVGTDGSWRQSNITNLQNGEQSVIKMNGAPSFIKEAPPVIVQPPKQEVQQIQQQNYNPMPSITSTSIITTGGNSIPSAQVYENFYPTNSLVPNLTNAQYPSSTYNTTNNWYTGKSDSNYSGNSTYPSTSDGGLTIINSGSGISPQPSNGANSQTPAQQQGFWCSWFGWGCGGGNSSGGGGGAGW